MINHIVYSFNKTKYKNKPSFTLINKYNSKELPNLKRAYYLEFKFWYYTFIGLFTLDNRWNKLKIKKV